MALSPDARRGFCICELTMCPYSRYQLGSEPGARFTSEPRISIVARPSDAVDVTGNSDRQRGLSAVTTSSLRRSHAFRDDGGLSWFALADSRLTTSFGRCSIPAATKARVGGLAPHKLRHMCGSPAIRSQASITTAQRLVGHATAIMTLDNYGHLYPDELDQVAQQMGGGRVYPVRTEASQKAS